MTKINKQQTCKIKVKLFKKKTLQICYCHKNIYIITLKHFEKVYYENQIKAKNKQIGE